MDSKQYLLDKAGMWTSGLCAVHCIALPALISVCTLNSWAFLYDERVENVVLAVSAVIGVSSLVPSYISHHRKVVPILILLSGFFFIGLSRVNVNESVFASCGAALLPQPIF
jgi:hypothetical protein